MVGQRHVERRGLFNRRFCRGLAIDASSRRIRAGGPCALQHDDKAVVFLQHRFCDLKKLIRPTGGADGFHHRGKPSVFRITRRDKVRTDIRTAIKLLAAALVAFATLEIAPWTARAALETTRTGSLRTIALRSKPLPLSCRNIRRSRP